MSHFASYPEYLNHWLFRALRKTALRKADGRCACGAPATEVHHHQGYPKPWGTFDVPANLHPLCHACHCRIHGKPS